MEGAYLVSSFTDIISKAAWILDTLENLKEERRNLSVLLFKENMIALVFF